MNRRAWFYVGAPLWVLLAMAGLAAALAADQAAEERRARIAASNTMAVIVEQNGDSQRIHFGLLIDVDYGPGTMTVTYEPDTIFADGFDR